ncbi:hypothetical protein EWM64_g7364 [Hericium alpestre]|uniref:Phytocyanin domain-containing protein n=1 Tax=Hericium alpestre TaxID=135208 RepID=A0A4Y9ZRH7_9AGAM|nr:hypothetical protein EWM64_g7364 [Hericium alpestre]
MRLSYIAPALLSCAALVAAQDQTVTVNIGGQTDTQGGIFQFIPNQVNATNGSTITFQWSGHPGNHSLTQSTFASPCQPMDGGFDSGWIFIPADDTDMFPTWNLTITNDSIPLWFFCKQLAPSPHCQAGMVGAINAPGEGDNSFQAFQQAAISSSGTPGQNAIGALVGSGASASAPPGPLTGEITGFAVPTSGAESSSSSESGSASSTSSSPASTTSASSGMSLTSNAFAVIFAAVLGINLA